MGQFEVWNIMKQNPGSWLTPVQVAKKNKDNTTNHRTYSLALSKLRRFGIVYRKRTLVKHKTLSNRYYKYYYKLTPKGARVIKHEFASDELDTGEESD